MKQGKIIAAALAALALAAALTACSASREDADGAPDLSEMICLPDGVVQQDGELLEIEDGDVPLAGEPGKAAGDDEEVPYTQQVIDLLNAERAAKGLAGLTTLPAMDTAAATRAEELVTSFSHTRPDGTSYRTALEANDVKADYTGENAAMGYRTPEDVVKGWMNSDGHRANILNAKYTHVGAGYFVDSATGYAYWCLLFVCAPPLK